MLHLDIELVRLVLSWLHNWLLDAPQSYTDGANCKLLWVASCGFAAQCTSLKFRDEFQRWLNKRFPGCICHLQLLGAGCNTCRHCQMTKYVSFNTFRVLRLLQLQFSGSCSLDHQDVEWDRLWQPVMYEPGGGTFDLFLLVKCCARDWHGTVPGCACFRIPHHDAVYEDAEEGLHRRVVNTWKIVFPVRALAKQIITDQIEHEPSEDWRLFDNEGHCMLPLVFQVVACACTPQAQFEACRQSHQSQFREQIFRRLGTCSIRNTDYGKYEKELCREWTSEIEWMCNKARFSLCWSVVHGRKNAGGAVETSVSVAMKVNGPARQPLSSYMAHIPAPSDVPEYHIGGEQHKKAEDY